MATPCNVAWKTISIGKSKDLKENELEVCMLISSIQPLCNKHRQVMQLTKYI
jgi:hypothetical protein